MTSPANDIRPHIFIGANVIIYRSNIEGVSRPVSGRIVAITNGPRGIEIEERGGFHSRWHESEVFPPKESNS